MATVPEPPPAGKPMYHCTYLGLSGVLLQPAAALVFLEPDRGSVVTLSPAEVLRDVIVNGEVSLTMRQYLIDLAAGGAAAVACGRTEGRQ